MQNKILLIQPANPFQVDYFNPKSKDYSIPTHLLFLASSITKNLNIPTKVIDLGIHFHEVMTTSIENYQKFEDELEKFFLSYIDEYKYFGICVYGSFYYFTSLSIAKILKKLNKDSIVIFGGFHPTFIIKDFINLKENNIDAIVQGEADLKILDVIKEFENKKYEPNEGLKQFVSEYIPDLNILPEIDWSLIDLSDVPKDFTLIVPYYASRDCPFLCSYCCKHTNLHQDKPKWRPLKIGRVMNELKTIEDSLSDYKLNIYFYDLIWGLIPEWRSNALDALINANLNSIFFMELRIDSIRKEDIKKHSKLNSFVSFGLDSGSERMLKIMNKTKNPKWYLKKMKEISELFEKYSSYYRTSILFGHPGEDKNTIEESFSYIDNLYDNTNYGIPRIHSFGLYPGSPVYNNKDFYRKEYGTNFLFEEWYYLPIDSYNINITHPSKDLSYFELSEKMHNFQDGFYDKIKTNFIEDSNRNTSEALYFLQTYKKRKMSPINSFNKDNFQQFKMGVYLIAKEFWKHFFNSQFVLKKG